MTAFKAFFSSESRSLAILLRCSFSIYWLIFSRSETKVRVSLVSMIRLESSIRLSMNDWAFAFASLNFSSVNFSMATFGVVLFSGFWSGTFDCRCSCFDWLDRSVGDFDFLNAIVDAFVVYAWACGFSWDNWSLTGLENWRDDIFFETSCPLSSILIFFASFKSYMITLPLVYVPTAIVWPSAQNDIELRGTPASIFLTSLPSTISKN